jgi:23S rRNA-/tRNA-specific pseudouridylate synthase
MRSWLLSREAIASKSVTLETVAMEARQEEAMIECIRENGLRKVKPYEFQYRCFAKGRWLHRSIEDVFHQEFHDRSPAYYTRAILEGHIQVNGHHVPLNYCIQSSDRIDHRLHRHEPPVTDQSIEIIAHTNDLLVVDKPASIPVHPTGRYRYNSLMYLLRREYGFDSSRLHRKMLKKNFYTDLFFLTAIID